MLSTVEEISQAYQLLARGIENREGDTSSIEAVEYYKTYLLGGVAKNLVEIAWNELGCDLNRITFKKKDVRFPFISAYLRRQLPHEIVKHVASRFEKCFQAKTDVHVNIDGRFVMGIECKAYTENAMLKRILVDFTLLKQAVPNLKCVLLQLESQLGGDYSQPLKPVTYGSPSTHTLLSYFDVDLHIITLLEGERKVDEPIHKQEHFKRMRKPVLRKAVNILKELLGEFIAPKPT